MSNPAFHCEKCYFAEYDEQDKIQIGCAAGALDKYRKIDQVTLVNEYVDPSRQCFRVDNHAGCRYYRNSLWIHYQEPLESKVEHVKLENQLEFDGIIYVDRNATVEQAMSLAGNLVCDGAANVRFALDNLSIHADLARAIDRGDKECPHYITTCADRYADRGDIIDETITLSKTRFIYVAATDRSSDRDFLKTYADFHETLTPNVLGVDSHGNFITYRHLYNNWGGNKPVEYIDEDGFARDTLADFVGKVEYLAKMQDSERFIWRYNV